MWIPSSMEREWHAKRQPLSTVHRPRSRGTWVRRPPTTSLELTHAYGPHPWSLGASSRAARAQTTGPSSQPVWWSPAVHTPSPCIWVTLYSCASVAVSWSAGPAQLRGPPTRYFLLYVELLKRSGLLRYNLHTVRYSFDKCIQSWNRHHDLRMIFSSRWKVSSSPFAAHILLHPQITVGNEYLMSKF